MAGTPYLSRSGVLWVPRQRGMSSRATLLGDDPPFFATLIQLAMAQVSPKNKMPAPIAVPTVRPSARATTPCAMATAAAAINGLMATNSSEPVNGR